MNPQKTEDELLSPQQAAPSTSGPITTSGADPSAISLPDPSLPAPNLASDEAGFTAADLIAQQSRLEAQANEAIPFQFDSCTYEKGAIRQPVYACKTCGGGGVCAGCSVSCHAEHDLVELFNKRKFRCDCGTPNLYRNKRPNDMGKATSVSDQLVYPPSAKPCSLRKPGFDPQNDSNRYNHNFQGSFCHCERGVTYDAEKEEETMFQCVVCEEWLHESCTSLRSTARKPRVNLKTELAETMAQMEAEPPLIDHDLFDLMICDACVRKPGHEVLRSYAGSMGWMVLIDSEEAGDVVEWDRVKRVQVPTQQELEAVSSDGRARQSWQIYGLPMDEESTITQVEVDAAADGALLSSVADLARNSGQPVARISETKESSNGQTQTLHMDSVETSSRVAEGSLKREASPPNLEPKRPKTGSHVRSEASPHTTHPTTCRRPLPLPAIAARPLSIIDDWKPALCISGEKLGGRSDIFLNDEFRSRICRCAECLLKWAGLQHVLEPEETYAPPSDPHASARGDDNEDAASVTSSTYDLGMAALKSLPREQMINSLHAYSKFRDALWEHLRPFAGSGKVVKEEDVRAFFQKTLNSDK